MEDIRPIATGDLPGIRRVYLSAWQEEFGPFLRSPLNLEEIEERGQKSLSSGWGLVAVEATHPIGYILCGPSPTGVEVLHWYVDPGAQGRGVGGRLANALIGRMPGQRLEWWAWQDNLRANQAYLAMGAISSERTKIEEIGGTIFSYNRWQLSRA